MGFVSVKYWVVSSLVAALLSVGFTESSFAAVEKRAARNLPQTGAVLSELDAMGRSLDSTKREVGRLKNDVRTARNNVKKVARVAKDLKGVEGKISRIRREVDSLARIPQLKLFKPVGKGLKSLQSNVATIRRKAEQIKKTKLDPAERQLLNLEREIESARRKIDQLILQVNAAKRQLKSYRDRVVRNGSRKPEVLAIETAARATKQPISELNNAVKEVQKIVVTIRQKVSPVVNATSQVARYTSAVSKVDAKLAPIDKKAKSVNKVMSKSISLKIPFKKKRVTVTVRKVLEAPGNVLKVAVKPLTAIAKKLLAPLTKKMKFDIKPPKELQELSRQLDSLNRLRFQVSGEVSSLKTKIRKLDDAKYKNALNKLKRLS